MLYPLRRIYCFDLYGYNEDWICVWSSWLAMESRLMEAGENMLARYTIYWLVNTLFSSASDVSPVSKKYGAILG